MSDYIISCCSTMDLSAEHMKKRDIRYVCFSYELGGKSYKDDLGVTLPLSEFYKAMEEGADTKTSQVNVDEFLEYFDSLLKEGKDVLHVSFSSGLSGSYNSACIAAEQMREKYPERKLIVLDSLAASSGYGLLMDVVADKRDEGLCIDDLAKWVEDNKLRVHHWFFSTTLKYYIRGGRVSKTAGFFGGMLGICPLLHVDREGRLIPMEKIRTKKKVEQATVQKMLTYCDGGADYDQKCFISHSHCLEDAKAVRDMVEQACPKLKGKVLINEIGTVIGAHSGPGTVALFFFGKSRAEE